MAHNLENITNISWDIVIVGTGMGGASVAYALADSKLKILVCEIGAEPSSVCPTQLVPAVIDGESKSLNFYRAQSLGGNSVYYGAHLERFLPEEFDPCGKNTWPFDYEEIEQFYIDAECRLEVSGTSCSSSAERFLSFKTPKKLGRVEEQLIKRLEDRKLAPYRSHIGAREIDSCNGCGTIRCDEGCKMDANTAFLQIASKARNIRVETNLRCDKILMRQQRVCGVELSRGGDVVSVAASKVILAAGVLGSTELLQRSIRDTQSSELGNLNDELGRGCMFHNTDFFAFKLSGCWSPVRHCRFVSSKKFVTSLAFGFSIQSLALLFDHKFLLRHLYTRYPFITKQRLLLIFTNGLTRLIEKVTSRFFLFATIIEDPCDLDNRLNINQASGDFEIIYTSPPSAKQRFDLIRQQIKKVMPGWVLFLNPKGKLNLGHFFGGLRIGKNPSTSVVNPHYEAHEVKGLFICDASIFPKSGSVNPALTIAANGLRLGSLIRKNITRTTD